MAPRIMLQLMQMLLTIVQALFANKADLALEVLALRQQLAVYKRKQPRPRLTDLDRAFWTVLKDHFAAWADALVIVKPSRPRGDSMTWRTFLKNQADAIWMCDFCVQHTVRFTALYIFVIMELGSRKVVHINVTEHPTLAWVKQQIRDATFDTEPKYLIHDNDGIFGQLGKPVATEVNGKKVSCRSTLDAWLAETRGIRGIPTPYHAPNANAHVERFIGTLRRELLDRILVWNEWQLRAVLAEYTSWFNAGRVHQGIHGIPDPDPELADEKPVDGKLVAMPLCGGLHHDYRYRLVA